MTREEFLFLIETEKTYEFTFNGTKYRLTYDKDSSGARQIIFGEVYDWKRYTSYGELMNEAKVGNCYLRELIPDLPL